MKTVIGALVVILSAGSSGPTDVPAPANASQAVAQAATGQDPATTTAPSRAGGAPRGRGGAPGLPNADGMTPAQVEGLFDAYVVMQARTALGLSDEQFLTFGARIGRLQMLRRRLQRQRQEHVRTLRGMLAPTGTFDEASAAVNVKALDDLVSQAGEQIRQAYVEIDQVLTPRQRAQFRVLEDQLERLKLDMLARARERARTPGR